MKTFSRSQRRHLLVLCFGLAIACTPLCAQDSATVTQSGPYAAASAAAEKQAKDWLGRGIPGLALSVAIDGKLVYSQGFGYADLEEHVSAKPTTKFRIGSISKPLTATALMELVEAGKIDLDAPIQKYVPSFPHKDVTVRMVGGHLGGIRHYKDGEMEIQRHYDNVQEGLKIFEKDPLIDKPGNKFHYSSYGYNLLSAAIESASGEPFLTYMQEHVFTPMGLTHTTADQNTLIIEERSRFYDLTKDGHEENAPYVDNSYKWAGGGFLSTSEDLVHFGSQLLQPGFLKESSLQLLFTSQTTNSGEETHYGIGWGIHKGPGGERMYEHSGGSVGGTSQLIVFPDSHVVIALVTNTSEGLWKRDEVAALAEAFAAQK
jgi:serine beta-lactamase-like protein LACTB, mitochondrial